MHLYLIYFYAIKTTTNPLINNNITINKNHALIRFLVTPPLNK